MSEQLQDTFMSSVADNLAESFFEGGATSQNIITPASKDEDGKVTPEKVDISTNNIKSPVTTINADDIIGDLLKKPANVEEIIDGQSKESKETVNQDTNTTVKDFDFLVKDGILNPYEDDTPIKTPEDLKNLINANKKFWMEEAKAEALKEDAENYPEEIKILLEYARSGGNDFKSFFKLLGQSEDIKTYDLEDPNDQRAIIRNYYNTQGWTESEIEDEILNLAENPERQKNQAAKLKPKLDKINKDALDEKKEKQKEIEVQQEKARQFFVKNVVDTLKKGSLGDLKLTKEEQKDIYSALIEERYQSFGGVTNRLGALLDQIQYVKPNYELLTKVTMYLSDPEGFEKKLKEKITTDVTATQVKKIKVEQQKTKIASEHNPEKETKILPKLNFGFVNPFE